MKSEKITKKNKKGQRRKQRKYTIIALIISSIAIIFGITAIIVALILVIPEPEKPIQNIEIKIEKIEIHVPENGNSGMDIPISEETEQESEPKPTISSDGPADEYYYNINEAEKILLSKLVYQEARGEDFKGKVAVAATVFNRLFYKGSEYEFDNSSIESIIRQAGQYASIKGVTVEMLEEVPECREAVEVACKGWDPTRKLFPNGAKFFYAHNSDLISEEQLNKRKGVEKLVIDNHTFHDSFNSDY